MAVKLKQSTSVVVSFGPFVDKTDGLTFETALAGTSANQLEHTSSGILISKNGGTLAARHATATASTYDAYGMYKVTLDTTDTATLGVLRVCFGNNDALPVWQDFEIVTANVWDTLFGADVLDSSLVQILGTAVSSPATAGILDVNVKNIDNDAASASGTVTFPAATLASTTNITTAAGCAVSSLGANVITAAATATDFGDEIASAIWKDTTAGDFTVAASVGKSIMNGVALGTGLTVAAVSGAVGSVTGAVGSVTGNVGGNVTGSTGSVVGAVGSVAGNVGGNVAGSVGSVTGNVGGDLAGDVGGDVMGSVTGTVGGFTAGAVDDLFSVDSGNTFAGAVAGSVVREIAENVTVPGAPTDASIADAVWDEDATGHQTGGTFGQAIGDPGADAHTIYGATVTDAAGVTIAADIIAVKAETASIQSDTNDLQARVPAALVSGRMDSSVGAMAADTITASAIATGAIDAAALAADALVAIADGILKRDMSAVSGEAARSVLNAARFLRNKWEIAAGTLTVYKEDDTTPAWDAALTTNGSAQPVVEIDPS